MSRAFQSNYMHWAKTQTPTTYGLSSSEVPHVRLDGLGVTVDDLELDGASHPNYLPLREAIAAHSGVAPSQVVTAEGTSMATFLAMAALVGPGDEVLFERPGYEPILSAASFLGATLIRFDRHAHNGYRLDLDAIAALVSDQTRLIFVTNLHNPSSALTNEDDLRALGDLAQSVGARVLVDEVYLDAADPPRRSAIHLGPAFVTTNSLTKCYGLSGLRCGWILAEPDVAERMYRLMDLFSVNRAHQAERLACFALAHLDAVAAGNATRCRANRALFNKFVDNRHDLVCMEALHGMTAFPRWTEGDPAKLDALLRDQYDCGIVPGHWFDAPDHFRVGLGGDTAILAEGLSRLADAMDALQ